MLSLRELVSRYGYVINENRHVLGREAEEAGRTFLVPGSVRYFEGPFLGFAFTFFPGFGPDHAGLVGSFVHARF